MIKIILNLFPGFPHMTRGRWKSGLLWSLLFLVHAFLLGLGIYRGKMLFFSENPAIISSIMVLVLIIAIWILSFVQLNSSSDGESAGGYSYWDIVKRKFSRDKKGITGAIIVLIMVYMAIFAPFLATDDPIEMNYSNSLAPPYINHPLGTDNYGRDIFSRIVFGSRVALGIGAGATLFNMVFGGFLGLIAGFYKGITDSLVMRLLEIINSIPFLVLAILVVSVFGSSPLTLIVVLGIFGLYPARIIRSEVLSVREEEYISAAQAVGAGDLRVLFRHVLPNAMASLLVVTTMRIGVNIIIVAGLSFLGLGINPPTPSWGAMLQQAQEYIRIGWWMAIWPGLAIFLTVLGFNLLGDSFRDVLDPKLSKTSLQE